MEVIVAESSVKTTVTVSQEISNDKFLGEVFEWLHNLSNVFDEKSRDIEKTTGLSRIHALIIKVISISPLISVTELGKRMRISPVSMVRILDHLEKQQLVRRIRSLKDRRVVELLVTDKANDIDLMLENMTHDILRCCFVVNGTIDLTYAIELLHKLSSFLSVNSNEFLHERDVAATRGEVRL